VFVHQQKHGGKEANKELKDRIKKEKKQK